MNYRSLGRTGVQVSELCIGCMMFGSETNDDDSADIIDLSLDAGVNFIDTANVYGRGRSEEAVGKALQRNGKRDAIVLATKVFAAMADDDPNMHGNHRRHIVEQCEASLRRLQTDWIDLYQIHRPMSQIPIDETLRALDDLVRAGKVRYIGASTYAAWQHVESLWAARELGLNRFVTEQPPYHMLDRRIERELIPMARTYGYAIIPWSPLAGGFLTGKYKRGKMDTAEGRHAAGAGRAAQFKDAAFDVVELVEKIAAEKGCSPAQFALAWVAAQPGVTCPIIGPRTMTQAEDNLGAQAVEVTDEDCKRIDEVAPPGGAVVPTFYNADFGPHLHRW